MSPVRELYYRSRRFGEAMELLDDLRPTGLRKAVSFLKAGYPEEYTRGDEFVAGIDRITQRLLDGQTNEVSPEELERILEWEYFPAHRARGFRSRAQDSYYRQVSNPFGLCPITQSILSKYRAWQAAAEQVREPVEPSAQPSRSPEAIPMYRPRATVSPVGVDILARSARMPRSE